ncbi:RrF2 family transcriptional regulator [Poriferisphaera sp. WC338]|uniref:RrF2 family transcriptional regulator n=1 Tax=Poriferisphaera sp. WC338 TaxID=3425129 RepID=UPI003D8149FF
MIKYGKTTQHAIAAVSRLAEVYDGGHTRLSSSEIAKSRNLSQTIVAKVLTILSQAGIVDGAPGPGGGYSLSRPPKEISFFDISEQFDRLDSEIACPFGPGWCGNNDPCPMHDQLSAMQAYLKNQMATMNFDSFANKKKG